MKTLIAIVAVTFFAATAAFAHEGQEHAAGGGLFGLSPEYIHVLLNPIPGYGLAMGILALASALVARNKTAQVIGLGLVIIACASVWPVTHFGTSAYKHVRELSDEAGVDALDEHMERAEKVVFFFYATALLGVVAIVSRRKFPRAATPLAVTTLLLGVASLGAGGWIAKAGGQIRHPEFRATASVSAKAGSPEHGGSEQSHEKMQMSETNSHQQHGEASKQSAGKKPLPNTLEGIWKVIHEQHGELESAVNEKKFSDVQSHAKEISALIKKLADVAHPDHKAAIEK
ncbi:MAG: hypothetical protein ABIP71_02205, partial [Verrucomicrobiota bacterium]